MTDDLVTLSAAIEIAFVSDPVPDVGERYPRVRGGEREPICPLVRWLVWHRDGGRCKFCSSTYGVELDHVIPWSAGGEDRATNLRVLCHRCNQERSNFRYREQPRLVPVTRSCDDCIHSFDQPLYRNQDRLLHEHFCDTCLTAFDFETDLDPARPAFCGHCLTISTTTNDLHLL